MNNNENYNDINISEDEMPVEQDPVNMDEIQEQENMDEVQEQKTGRDTAELVSVLVKDHKKLLMTQRITNVAVLVLTLAVVILTIALSNSVTNISRYVGDTKIKVEDFITTANRSLEGIDTFVENANKTIVDSQQGISDALSQINKVDIETLNESIADLAAIIGPLAKLFGR